MKECCHKTKERILKNYNIISGKTVLRNYKTQEAAVNGMALGNKLLKGSKFNLTFIESIFFICLSGVFLNIGGLYVILHYLFLEVGFFWLGKWLFYDIVFYKRVRTYTDRRLV